MAFIKRHSAVLAPPAAAAVATPAEPIIGAKHICIDLETGNGSKEAIELAARFYKAPSNMKDEEKIAAKEKVAIAKFEEKSALLDLAPMAVFGIVTETSAVIFHSIKVKKEFDKIEKIPADVYGFKTEREMLGAVREWLDPRTLPNSVIIGFNLKHFDLPKIRGGYVRNRLVMPKVFQPAAREGGVEVYDVMKEFVYNFTTEKAGVPMISLEEVVARLGLPEHKTRLSGAEIPRMIADGQGKEVCAYNYLDLASTYAAYLAMTGQYQDQQQEGGA